MAAYLPKFPQTVGEKKTARFYPIEHKFDAIADFEPAANIALAR